MTISRTILNEYPGFAGQLVTTVLLPQYSFILDEDQDAELRRSAARQFTRTAMGWIFSSNSDWRINHYRKALAVPLGEADPGHMSTCHLSDQGMCFAHFPRDQQHAYITGFVTTGLALFGRSLGGSGFLAQWHFTDFIRSHLIGLVLYLHTLYPEEVSLAVSELAPAPATAKASSDLGSTDTAPPVAAVESDDDLPF